MIIIRWMFTNNIIIFYMFNKATIIVYQTVGFYCNEMNV